MYKKQLYDWGELATKQAHLFLWLNQFYIDIVPLYFRFSSKEAEANFYNTFHEQTKLLYRELNTKDVFRELTIYKEPIWKDETPNYKKLFGEVELFD